MLSKSVEKRPKRTLGERSMKRSSAWSCPVNCQAANGSTRSRWSTSCGEPNPVPRGDLDTGKGRSNRD